MAQGGFVEILEKNRNSFGGRPVFPRVYIRTQHHLLDWENFS